MYENCTWMAGELGIAAKREPARWLPQFANSYTEGNVQNHSMHISMYTAGSAKNQRTWCRAIIRMPENPGLKLSIARRDLFSGLQQMFRSSNVVKTGDEEFDRTFLVQCNDPAFIQAVLFPEVRTRFTRTWMTNKLSGSITLDSHDLKYTVQGSFTTRKSCERLVAAARLLSDVAVWVDAYGEVG